MPLSLKIIVGTTRPTRRGPLVGRWVEGLAKQHGGFEVELVDLANIELPLLDEPEHPAKQAYVHAHTKRWSAIIEPADAFVFVTPEYDYFVPASLVNAIQTLLREWRYKAAAIVSYGGVSGGLRGAQELRQLLGNVSVMAIPSTVPLAFYGQHIDDDGVFAPGERAERSVHEQLDELVKWATALRTMRTS